MTNDTSSLRLAIALGHALPGGRVAITFVDGTTVHAAHGGVDPLTPCALRALAITGAWPLCPRAAARVRSIDVSAIDAHDVGGGIYRRPGERWFATLLGPERVGALLGTCPLEPIGVLDASLRPDGELGVTVAVLSSGDEHALDAAAQWAVAACYVEELTGSMSNVGE